MVGPVFQNFKVKDVINCRVSVYTVCTYAIYGMHINNWIFVPKQLI